MIVDDETLALNRLERLLRENGIEQISAFNDPISAQKEASKTKFDAVFLDISMPGLNGLELAQTILQKEPDTFIIFQTAYEEYALEAFNKGGLGYLLKPIDSKSVQAALQKITAFKKENNVKKRILGKSGERIYIIEPEDIFYIQADLDEVIIRIKECDVYARKKISDFESYLKDKEFFRIHRSIIVNVNKIKSMQSIEQSKLVITFEGIEESVTSSKEGAKEFREYLERRGI
jgi:two-component system LytT family response regulator